MAGAPNGGAELFFERLALGLHGAGTPLTTVIRKDADRAARLAALHPHQLAFGGRADVTTPWRLARLAKTTKPAIILTFMNRASRICPRGPHINVGRLGGYYALKHYQRMDHLVGNTQDLVDYMVREGWPQDRAHYLPNFVTHHEAAPRPRAQHDTPEGVPLILSLGRLHDNKGFDTLITALKDVPDAYLWLAGDGPNKAALTQQAEDLGVAARIRFLGWQDDVAALMGAADIYCCPSRHEPLGNVVVEAFAYEKPVVACASQGPSALIEDGISGLLAPVDNAAALAAALRDALGDSTKATLLAKAGHLQWQENFTPAAVIGAYQRFFSEIVTQPKRKI